MQTTDTSSTFTIGRQGPKPPEVVSWENTGDHLELKFDRDMQRHHRLVFRSRADDSEIVYEATLPRPNVLRLGSGQEIGLGQGAWDVYLELGGELERLRVNHQLEFSSTLFRDTADIELFRTVFGNLSVRVELFNNAFLLSQIECSGSTASLSGTLQQRHRDRYPVGYLLRLRGVDPELSFDIPIDTSVYDDGQLPTDDEEVGAAQPWQIDLDLAALQEQIGRDSRFGVELVALFETQGSIAESVDDGGPWREQIPIRNTSGARIAEDLTVGACAWKFFAGESKTSSVDVVLRSSAEPAIVTGVWAEGESVTIDATGCGPETTLVARAENWGREAEIGSYKNGSFHVTPHGQSDGMLREPSRFLLFARDPETTWLRRLQAPASMRDFGDAWSIPGALFDVGRLSMVALPQFDEFGLLSLTVEPHIDATLLYATTKRSALRVELRLKGRDAELFTETNTTFAQIEDETETWSATVRKVEATAVDTVKIRLTVAAPTTKWDLAAALVKGATLRLGTDSENAVRTRINSDSRWVYWGLRRHVQHLFRAHPRVGRSRSEWNIRIYALMRKLARVGKAPVFQSFVGRSYADSPRAIHEYLLSDNPDLKSYWVRDGFDLEPIPGKHTVVVRPGTLHYYWAITRGRYFIANTNFPDQLVKRPGQYHLQTWHGTPLKKIGADVNASAPGGGLQQNIKLKQRTERWDGLVSPSPYVSTILPRAYSTRATVVERGYPRNDVIATGMRDPMALEEAAGRCGVDTSRLNILYAPTWREGKGTKAQRFNSLPLSAERFAQRYGDKADLLIRTHYLASNALSAAYVADCIKDVGWVSDSADLLACVDLVITDYSSVFFDVLIRQIPIVFMVPDLDEYEERTRGFYWDLRTYAPGPLVKTETGLFDYLDSFVAGELPAVHHDDYIKLFAPHDDGYASERAWKRFLELTGGTRG